MIQSVPQQPDALPSGREPRRRRELRLSTDPAARPTARQGECVARLVGRRNLAPLAERPGIIGAHLLEGDPAASRTGTAEKRLRGDSDAIADWIVLVGGYDADALQVARDHTLAHEQLVTHGAAAAPTVGLYQLLHAITESDLPVQEPA